MSGVFLVGEFSYGALAASYERAFAELGVSTSSFDSASWREMAPAWMRSRLGHRLTIGSAALRHRASVSWNDQLRQAVESAGHSVVLIFNGHFVMADIVLQLRSSGRIVICINTDNPFPPHGNSRPETLPVAHAVDHYLVWSEALAERLRLTGIPHAKFHPFGWDDALFPYRAPAATPCDDVIFIGGWDPERERLLSLVAERHSLRIWGPAYWGQRTPRGSAARRAWQETDLRGPDAARVIQEAAISLNVLRAQHYTNDVADGVIMRTFEVPGCGGFALSTRSGGATRIFPEGRAGAYFSSAEECLQRIAHYLEHTDERHRIAADAHDIVAREHRYTHRAREILQLAGRAPTGHVSA